ncbi:MAG: acyl-CoA carboxylase epsilon subunit, partial [Angustibacter sp.]
MTERPFLAIHRGNPDPSEIAALLAALLATGGTPSAEPPTPQWSGTPWRGA